MKRIAIEREGVHTYVRHLPHAPAKVFRALTNEAELRAWFPAKVARGIGEGSFVVDDGGVTREGRVLVFEPPHRLEYTFGNETLRWRIAEAPGGSVIVLVTEEASATDPPQESANDAPANDTTTKAMLARVA